MKEFFRSRIRSDFSIDKAGYMHASVVTSPRNLMLIYLCHCRHNKRVFSDFGLWFFQGALLKDDKKVLMNAQEGRTKALRQWRMQTAKEIRPAIIKSYVKEAINLAREGRQIAPSRGKPVIVPPELKKALRADKSASEKFRNLRLGLQREYAEYIVDAKRDDTKLRRIEKILPMLRNGVGLHDKYR